MKKSSKKVLIVLVVLILLAMAVAYAATTRTLTILGTGRIAADISEIEFTNVECTDGEEGEDDEATFTDDTLTFDVTLTDPTDAREYTATVKNNSNADAVVTDIKYYLVTTEDTEKTLAEINAADPAAIKFEVEGLAVGTKIAKDAEINPIVCVYWDNTADVPEVDSSKTLKVVATFGIDE